MSQKLFGNVRGLSPSLTKKLQRLFTRKIEPSEIVPLEFARELYSVAVELSRRVGVFISREGEIEEVCVGSKDILYLPDLGRYRLGKERLRRIRLVFSDLSSPDRPLLIPADIMTDLEKLRLDMVVGVKGRKGKTSAIYAHLLPHDVAPPPSDIRRADSNVPHTRTEVIEDLGVQNFDFIDFIEGLESELDRVEASQLRRDGLGVVLVSVSDASELQVTASLDELSELARTAGVEIIERIVQRRKPDPKLVLGKGKLEEVVLRCLRLGAEMIIFDTELRPSQWRAITNSTELKVIDRSMLILDIFAQRAQSSEGRLQVELAQLKYNLPRLVEKDAGLSRLSGGIGGRGPGETKLEVGRRRIRDRIAELEKRIDQLSSQRGLKRQRRKENQIPVVVIVGYTNVGKSTLFNELTGSTVLAENRLFATLDPFQRRVMLPRFLKEGEHKAHEIILSDTVGFIRKLPEELKNAFRATLEELGEASLLIHVLDASDPAMFDKKRSVEEILEEMELTDIPQLLLFNKIDLLNEEEAKNLAALSNGLAISAANGDGLRIVLEKIEDHLFPTLEEEGQKECEILRA